MSGFDICLFRPREGYGLRLEVDQRQGKAAGVTVPERSMGYARKWRWPGKAVRAELPSPRGVWVVPAKLYDPDRLFL